MKIDKIVVRDRNTQYETSELGALVDEIVTYCVDKISERAIADNSDIKFISPRTLIAVLVSNLVLNLAHGTIHAAKKDHRKAMFRDLVAEISCMLMEAWGQLEAANPNDEEEVH